MSCIFCKIISGEIPSHKIYEDDEVLAFLDIKADVEGHTLVIPKRHCVNVLDCPDMALSSVALAVKRISVHFTQNCGFDGVNIICNNGETAHQEVGHLHFHIYPRLKGDGFRLCPSLNARQTDLAATASRLKITD